MAEYRYLPIWHGGSGLEFGRGPSRAEPPDPPRQPRQQNTEGCLFCFQGGSNAFSSSRSSGGGKLTRGASPPGLWSCSARRVRFGAKFNGPSFIGSLSWMFRTRVCMIPPRDALDREFDALSVKRMNDIFGRSRGDDRRQTVWYCHRELCRVRRLCLLDISR